MKRIESYNKVFKGKSASISVPLISMRYNAEDEELEQLVETPDAGVVEGTSVSCTESPLMEKKVKDSSSVIPKINKRSGSLEDPTPGETWKFFSEIKGRITKTVEEKLEGIKSERIKKKEKKKKLTTGGENSSISDSEEKSEASSSRQSPVKSESLKESDGESSDLSTPSMGRKNSVDVTEIDISDTTPVKDESASFKKGLSSSRKYDKVRHNRHKRKKRESVEVAEEAFEEISESSTSLKQVEDIKLIGIVNKWWLSMFIALLATSAKYSLLSVELLWLGLGVAISVLFRWLFDWFTKSDSPEPEIPLFYNHFDLDTVPIMAEKIESIPNLNSEYTLYEGWINEYDDTYNPESYKVSLTKTVFMKLEGCKLILSTPRKKVPKRASWNEPDHPKDFSYESTYNINGCFVSLLPQGLTRKRLWSKKYPIYIKLLPNSYVGTVYKDKEDDDYQNLIVLNSASVDPHTSDNDKTDVGSDVINDDRRDDDGNNTQDDTDVMPDEEVVFTNQISPPLETVVESKEVSNEEEVLDDLDFVHVSSTLVGKKNALVLFTRSDREKELWFRRLVAAVGFYHFDDKTDDLSTVIGESLNDLRLQRSSLNNNYFCFMKTLAQVIPKSKRKPKWKSKESHSGSMWFNIFVSRILFDTFNDPLWMSKIQDRVQRKLSTVRLPSVIEELVVSKLEIQGPSPMVESWSEPKIDDQGIWADLGVSYKGQFLMTVDIKLNLVKKKINQTEMELNQLSSPEKSKPESKSAIYNSSIEDSGESSSEELEKPKIVDTPSPNSPQKHRNVVERIATSKYFLQVADNKYVKKALEGVSNTHISLIVEVKGLVGTVVINIPPPPSDRLWYGFRPKPKLWLSARPVVGERVLKIINITRWIEKRLYKEFEKILVMPNMDDLVIPIMDKTLPF